MKQQLDMKRARNCAAWALGKQSHAGFHIRKICWGLMMTNAEKRDGEEIRACVVLVEKHYKPRRSPL